MIVKKIRFRADRPDPAGRSRHVRDLVDYMQIPAKASDYQQQLLAYLEAEGYPRGVDRLLHLSARNFVSEPRPGDVRLERAEMMATAQTAVRSENPLAHWLLSWREGEAVTAEDVDRAVTVFTDRMGLSGHQIIYAMHGDTHNIHVHLAINRFDPLTRRIWKPHDGQDIELAHKALAFVVEDGGWQPEAGARYELRDGLPHRTAASLARDALTTPALPPAVVALEGRTACKSAQRVAQEQAWAIIRNAGGWQDMHAELAERGMRFERVRNGAVIYVGDQPVKASSVDSRCTIRELEKRYRAPFLARSMKQPVAERAFVEMMPATFRGEEYVVDGMQAGAERDRELSRREERRAALAEDIATVMDAGWSRGQGNVRDLLIDELKEAHREEEAAVGVRAKRRRDYEEWLRSVDEAYFAERWRKRLADTMPPMTLAGLEDRVSHDREPPQAGINGYKPYVIERGVRYARDGEGTAFVDWGRRIEIVPQRGDDAIAAALRLASVNFTKGIMVEGEDAVQQRVYRVAIEAGLSEFIKNADFVRSQAVAQERRMAERRRRRAEQTRAAAQQRRDADGYGSSAYDPANRSGGRERE